MIENLLGPVALGVGLGSSSIFVEKILREGPYQNVLTSVRDKINPSRIEYKDKPISFEELKERINDFPSIKKVIVRDRWIPAGAVWVKSAKEKLETCTPEEAYDFIMENIAPRSPTDGIETKDGIYSTGEMYATLRNVKEDMRWLHVYSKLSCPFAFNQIDLLGKKD